MSTRRVISRAAAADARMFAWAWTAISGAVTIAAPLTAGMVIGVRPRLIFAMPASAAP